MAGTMRRFRRTARVLAVVLALGAAVVTVQAAAGPVTHSGFDAEEAKIVESAVARFQAAGLELPLTHVRKVSFGERCQPRGQAVDSWPIKIAKICTVSEDVVVHELAHAWAFVNLDSVQRHEFALRRGTPTWRSREHPWMDRASEHAADIITWYLYWSENDGGPYRIGGDVSVEAFLNDLSWLMAAANAREASQILAERAVDLAPLWVSSESQ